MNATALWNAANIDSKSYSPSRSASLAPNGNRTSRNILSVDLGCDHDVSVLGDCASLRRLLWILLDNAFKYTPSPGHINVTLRTSAREAVVAVSDDRFGIPEADLPHIFDRFYRADPSRGQVEGSGLGLSIAQWVAEMHHAQLVISSPERLGTTVGIRFPKYAD